MALLVALTVVHGARARPPESVLHPALSAVFSETSYNAGQLAKLRVLGHVHRLDLQILRAGAERDWSSAGRLWGPPTRLRFRKGTVNTVRVRLGTWPSGLYFARLTAPGGRAVTFAPFVIKPSATSTARVAVVLPDLQLAGLQLLRRRRDGTPRLLVRPTRSGTTCCSARPFAGDGKPPHYRTQQRGFLRFLVHTGKTADYLTDEDLEQVASGDDLARLYDLSSSPATRST